MGISAKTHFAYLPFFLIRFSFFFFFYFIPQKKLGSKRINFLNFVLKDSERKEASASILSASEISPLQFASSASKMASRQQIAHSSSSLSGETSLNEYAIVGEQNSVGEEQNSIGKDQLVIGKERNSIREERLIIGEERNSIGEERLV